MTAVTPPGPAQQQVGHGGWEFRTVVLPLCLFPLHRRLERVQFSRLFAQSYPAIPSHSIGLRLQLLSRAPPTASGAPSAGVTPVLIPASL